MSSFASLSQILSSMSNLTPYQIYSIVPAAGSSGYDGWSTSTTILYPPNATTEIVVNIATGVTADISFQGNNVSTLSHVSLSDQDIVVIKSPPAAGPILLTFTFNGIGFDPESGPMGILTFNSIDVSESVISEDLILFSVNDSIRVLNSEAASYVPGESSGDVTNGVTSNNVENYPIYGDTYGIVSVKSGVITKQGNLTLGTD